MKILDRCICCNSDKLSKTISLGNLPLANDYKDSPNEEWDRYPLELNTCTRCFHSQLSVAIDPDILFKNYSYVSGTSNTLKNFFDEFALKLTKRFPNKKTVLDIACNDGSQLDAFKNYGWDTYGVDPAENIVCDVDGHVIANDYWQNVDFMGDTFDLIVAQNVFAHTSDVDSFLKNCIRHMDQDSVLLIQTSQCNMFQEGQFDTIYHEHISYFNSNSMKSLLRRHGLYLNKVSVENIHGNSYLFEISKNNLGTVEPMSFEDCLYDYLFYDRYREKCLSIRDKFISGNIQYGIGAAAKGMTFLGFANKNLDIIFDESHLKVGKYCPYSTSPIVHLENASKYEGTCVILAWNFADEIKKKSQAHGLEFRIYNGT